MTRSASKQASPPAARRSQRVHGSAALLLYVVDALVFAQGAIAGLTTFVMVIVGIYHVGRGIFSDRRYLRSGFTILVIYSMMMVSVVATIWANNRIARGRAEEIVAALKSYKAATGDYPVELGALVPTYMPSVPRAKYTLMFSEFSYHYEPTKHQGFLMYVSLPPFGRPTYSLETNTWGFLD